METTGGPRRGHTSTPRPHRPRGYVSTSPVDKTKTQEGPFVPFFSSTSRNQWYRCTTEKPLTPNPQLPVEPLGLPRGTRFWSYDWSSTVLCFETRGQVAVGTTGCGNGFELRRQGRDGCRKGIQEKGPPFVPDRARHGRPKHPPFYTIPGVDRPGSETRVRHTPNVTGGVPKGSLADQVLNLCCPLTNHLDPSLVCRTVLGKLPPMMGHVESKCLRVSEYRRLGRHKFLDQVLSTMNLNPHRLRKPDPSGGTGRDRWWIKRSLVDEPEPVLELERLGDGGG